VNGATGLNGSNGTERPTALPELTLVRAASGAEVELASESDVKNEPAAELEAEQEPMSSTMNISALHAVTGDGVTGTTTPDAFKDAFVRQLQLDRLTLRQMRSILMNEDARRAIEVAVGATEATYERLALILFGSDLPQLLGKPIVPPTAPTISAEERLELQREKARIRARLRRAAIKAARQTS